MEGARTMPTNDEASHPPATAEDLGFMRRAIDLMRKAGIVDRTGGPFGAVIVRDGQVLAASGNSVMRDNDPSAHAEVNAIRAACRGVGSPHLTGAVLYCSCEPCPMCYATAYWARIGRIFYAAQWSDYADLFDDLEINRDLPRPYSQRMVPLQQIGRAEAQAVWQEFRKLPDPARY
jgi:guanine deaminase